MNPVLETIQIMFNTLNNVSIFSMFPFLVVSPIDDRKDMYRFLQYKGQFYSRPFLIDKLKLKEFTWITPFRYFLNKRIFAEIEKLSRLEDFDVFISFQNHYTLRITLYNRNVIKVINYKVKLFSGSINFSFADFFTYWFKLNKKQRLEVKIKMMQLKSERLQYLSNLPNIEDLKNINKETRELINNIKKRYIEEQRQQKKDLKKNQIDNIIAEEKQRQGLDMEKMSDKGYNDLTISDAEIENKYNINKE